MLIRRVGVKEGVLIVQNVDWTEILLALIGLLSVIITGVLVPYFRAKTKDYRASLTEKERQTFDFWVDKGVLALELYIKDYGQGAIKKAQVKVFIRNFIETKELNISEEQLDILIDVAVNNLVRKPWEQLTEEEKIAKKEREIVEIKRIADIAEIERAEEDD